MDNKKELLDNLHRFKLPEISLDGVEIIGLNVIHRDDINDEMFDNGARTQDNLSARSNSLQTSFINGGYDYNQPVGIVSDRGDGKYDRLDSFARSDAFMKLGWDYMVYCIVKCENELSETSMRMWANRMIPKTDNTQNDLVQNAVNLLQKKLILNDETSIRKWLKSVEPNRDSAFIEKCLITVKKKVKTNKPNEVTQTYTDQSIFSKWIKKHWANPPVHGFIKEKQNGFNSKRNCYQVTLPLGYEARKLQTALEHFVDAGKKTEFILHISKGVSDLQTLNKQRNSMRKNIKDFTDSLDKFYGKKGDWDECFEIIGFVPQHIDEDIKQIIPF
jgi:hypothetical protein